MTQEQLRMQMLAGIITESQYKKEVKEIEGRGKIGKSYPSPLSTSEDAKISLTPQQKKVWEDAMIKRYKEIAGDDDDDPDNVEEAIYNIPYASEDVLINILLGLKSNYYWDDEYERNEAVEKKGMDVKEIENYASKLVDEFQEGNTNNPEIKKIQSWIKAWF